MADATARILKDINDPRLYYKVEGVPVFTPHKLKKYDAAGNLVDVEVTEEDLEEIAVHNNQRVAQSGNLAVLTIGHRNPDKRVPEKDQPPVVGYGKNWRVGRFGPGNLPCLFYDEFVRVDRKDQIGRNYPHRSADYYRGRFEISGVAAMVRDPELDMGMVVYGNAGEELLCYAREIDMADPTLPPDPAAPMDAPPAPGGDSLTPDEMEQHMRHCASSPHARKHHEQMLRYAGEAGAGPGVASPTDFPPPAMGSEPPAMMGRTDKPETYARVLSENRQLKTRLHAAEQRAQAAERVARLAQYGRELEQLAAEEGVILDAEEELKLCGDFDRARFEGHKQHIALHYAHDPAGGRSLPVARTPARVSKEGNRDDAAKAIKLATKKGLDFDTALAQVRQME